MLFHDGQSRLLDSKTIARFIELGNSFTNPITDRPDDSVFITPAKVLIDIPAGTIVGMVAISRSTEVEGKPATAMLPLAVIPNLEMTFMFCAVNEMGESPGHAIAMTRGVRGDDLEVVSTEVTAALEAQVRDLMGGGEYGL